MKKNIPILFLFIFINTGFAKNYFVNNATSGSDANPGTLSQPFKTIQKAAGLALAGDTVFIRKGIYRETITPANSGVAGMPIVFINYQEEEVIISGADAVQNWILDKNHKSGKVWKAKMNGTLNSGTGISAAGMDQVYVNGSMATEARWPNITVHPATVERSSYAQNDNASLLVQTAEGETSTARYTDSDISTFPANYFKDAYVNFLAGYFWWPATGKVIANSSNTFDFTYSYKTAVPYQPRGGDIYYFWGKLELLNAPGEWFRRSDDTLFLWAPTGDSPNNHLIEVKRRTNVFVLDGKSFLTIRGIKIFGGGVKTTSATANLTLDHIEGQYLAHYSIIPGWWATRNLGMVLRGPNTMVSNSHIYYTVEDAVKLTGNNSKAINNVIHDAGYLGMAGILLGCIGDNMELRNNTVWGAGGANALDFRESTKSKILYNDASASGKGTFDGGILMGTRNFDAQNTEIAYNFIHDGKGISDGAKGFYGTSGVYLEGTTKNYIIHHNIIWNTGSAVSMPGVEGGFENIKIYNNSFPNSNIVLVNTQSGTASVEIKNNIFGKFQFNASNVNVNNVKNNIFTAWDYTGLFDNSNKYNPSPKLADPENYNFAPVSGSPLIDAGLFLSPFTNEYTGTAPDIGALEAGKAPFVAGALVRLKDISSIRITYDDSSFPNKRFTVSGLPQGRKLPSDAKLKIGNAASGGLMSYDVGANTFSYTNVPTGGQTGIQPISLDLGKDSIIATASTINLTSLGTSKSENSGQLEIFPNPFKESILVRTNEEVVSIQVLNLSGEVVFSGEQLSIDLSNLASGIYFIKINTFSNNTIVRKLIKY